MTAKELIEELTELIATNQIPEDAEVTWEHECEGTVPVDSVRPEEMICAKGVIYAGAKYYYDKSHTHIKGDVVWTVHLQ